MALDQQRVHVTVGRVRAFVELRNQRMLRADLQHQPYQRRPGAISTNDPARNWWRKSVGLEDR